jgi:putative ATP-binding cassette transporter
MSLSQKFAAFKAFARQGDRFCPCPTSVSEEKWKARGLLSAIVVLNLAAVYMLVLINDWNRLFLRRAAETRTSPCSGTQLGRFTYIAFAYIIIAVYKFYLTQLLELRWAGLDDGAHHPALAGPTTLSTAWSWPALPSLKRWPGQGDAPDNPDQRIQEDLKPVSPRIRSA